MRRRTYEEAVLARGLSAPALAALRQAQLTAQRLALEADFHAREAALKQQLAEERARSGECEALRLHVAEHLLTPKCPRCARAFLGFNGCFALRCAPDDTTEAAAAGAAWAAGGFCGAGLCAWCFTDCGQDAHEHVKRCEHNRSGRPYHGTMAQFDAVLRALRLRRLRAYLPTLQPPALRRSLLGALREELADLGIDAQRDGLLLQLA
jgi:hypothetical protein